MILRLLLINFERALNNNKESYAMFRVIISSLLTLFLIAGLIGISKFMFSTSTPYDKNVIAQVSEKKDTRLSIKEIESITASSNFRFTSVNALR